MTDARSRREWLAAVGAATTTAAAGCASLDNPPVDEPREAPDVDPGAGDATRQTIPPGVAQFRSSLERWGYYPDETVADAVEEAWRIPAVNTGDHSAAKASAVPTPDGGVVLPGDTGDLLAITTDGDVRWRGETDAGGRGIHGTPAVADGRAYVGAYDGVLYAFALDSGDLEWSTDLGGSIGSSPLYLDGELYVSVEFPNPEGRLFAVDAATGDVTWEEPDHRPTDHPHSSPAISLAAGRMVCGSNDGYCYCWSFPELEFQWRFATDPPASNDGEIKGPIATYDGAAFFGSWDFNVYRVDLETGEEDWRFETGDLSMTGPAIDPERDVVYMGSHDDHLYALDAATGDVEWRFRTGRPLTGCATVAGDRVLTGSKDGTLYALEADSGDEVWRVDHEGWITSAPRVVDGEIYYAERAPDPEGGDTDGGGYKLVAAE
ncbi:outer membrane protein assembly factor BamB family protein [Halorubrum ezzemoulense]|uniref:Pyrrolo-quinoline quinone n=1 Tax=Halorubrum ezzemoulense TaxID=337243 RepID=A0A256JY20_HALEZ|nr:PQQ-binding-like beta-propeller repeat protein [Halorubrum ezzemoulense]OYR73768.1 pyrrolo-quinoline quinone [Halorubrum ezzemoulense]